MKLEGIHYRLTEDGAVEVLKVDKEDTKEQVYLTLKQIQAGLALLIITIITYI